MEMINSTGLASCFVKTGSKEHHMEVSKKSSWSPWNFSSPFCGTGTAKNLVVQEPGTSDENNNSSCNDGEEITIAILDPPQGAEVVSIQPKKTKEILGFLRLQQRNLCGERQDEIQLKNFPFNYDRLSLRDSQLKPSSFFVNMPKPALKRIKVLDVGRATFVEDSDVAWPKLRGLRELYLEGVVRGHSATFLENVLKKSKNLEVLDLERARLDQGDLVTIAKRLPELRELYLGYTNVWDSDLRELERSGSRFDKLRNVCMTQTSVSHIGVSSLLNQCPSLQKVSVRSKFVGYGPARDLENSRHGFRVYREENNHALAFFSDRGCGHFRSKHGNRASDL